MRTHLVIVLLLVVIALAACGPTAPREYEEPYAVVATEPPVEYQQPAAGIAPSAKQEPAAEGETNTLPGGVVYDTGAIVPDTAAYNRMVIKNAEIYLLVKDSDVAIDGITQLVGDVSGYIISSQIWYSDYNGENYKYATISIGIPADQFEVVLRRLRGLAIRVLNENASGQDVTDQYVDLQSQLTNLEATRDRIKSFLEQAKTVDEALRINQQLSDIEAQIEQVKGKMNYLTDRSAFSTVTISIEPDLPPLPPTATPTPIPTVTPIPWDPGKTFDQSSKTLTTAYQGIIDFLIWFFIVLVPILLPIVLIVWLVWWIIRRSSVRKSKG